MRIDDLIYRKELLYLQMLSRGYNRSEFSKMFKMYHKYNWKIDLRSFSKYQMRYGKQVKQSLGQLKNLYIEQAKQSKTW